MTLGYRLEYQDHKFYWKWCAGRVLRACLSGALAVAAAWFRASSSRLNFLLSSADVAGIKERSSALFAEMVISNIKNDDNKSLHDTNVSRFRHLYFTELSCFLCCQRVEQWFSHAVKELNNGNIDGFDSQLLKCVSVLIHIKKINTRAFIGYRLVFHHESF